jgi:quercetin dioxygenase-like cupin family protein
MRKGALRFAFLPGQEIESHKAPHSPVHLMVLQGGGMFAGADGVERECSEGMMVVFDSGEKHTVRALDEKLVYVAVYKENPATYNYESEHRKMVENRPQHHAHDKDEEAGNT